MFEEDGGLYIVDFKTDRCADKAELWARYGTQLVLYGEAMARVFKKPVAACMLYSFWLGEPVLPEDVTCSASKKVDFPVDKGECT